MTENKTWKQADNEVVVVGALVENNLEMRDFDVYKDGKATGEKRSAIAGDLVVRSADNENHTIRLKQFETTNAGKANRLHAGLVTIMNETVSIADTEKNPEATPTRLKVVGELNLNEYAGHDGEIRSFPSIKGIFVNRLDADDKTENKAEFDLEGMVTKVISEMSKGENAEETGRKKVSLLIPLYSSIIPMEFVVNEGQGADYVEENFTKGSSVRVYGNLVNFRDVKKKVVEMGFGDAKVEEKTTYRNELLIKGGSVYDPDINPNKIIDAGLVNEKLVDREKYLENLKTRAKEKEQNGANKAKTGFGFGDSAAAAKTSASPLTGAGEEVDLTGLF